MDGSRNSASDAVTNFLEHYGVKGMRWGVRKEKSAPSPQQIKKADNKFEKRAKKFNTQRDIYYSAISDFKNNPELKAINAKPKYSATRKFKYGLTTDRRLYKQYNDEVAVAFLKHLDSKARQKTNASGTRSYRATKVHPDRLVRPSKNRWKVTTGPVQHAADNEIEIEVIRDEQGFITDLKPVETAMAQAMTVENFLEHYGVKGMRWGRRKNAPPATSEAERSIAIRSKAKAGKVKALTNAELRESIERMRLEQEFKRLTGNEKSQVGKFVANTLLNVGKQQLGNYLAAQVPVVGGLVKKGLNAGVTKSQRASNRELGDLLAPMRQDDPWDSMSKRQRRKYINTPEAWGGGS